MTDLHFPEKGFYVHYKHDPDGPLNNYIYEVVGIGRNTEEKTYTVLYRPVYENDWMPPADLQSRPLEMFFDTVEKNGKAMQRFALITNVEKISELKRVSENMYPRSI